jgi:formate dehydrogenase major subunit
LRGKEEYKVNVTRREFLQLSAGFTGFLITSSAFGLVKVPEALASIDSKIGTEVTSICYGCACGCGVLATVKNFGAPNAKLINSEGDPSHPVNEGALCSKCQAIYQMINHRVPNGWLNPGKKYDIGTKHSEWDPHAYYGDGSIKAARNRRLARPLYRAPGATQWEVMQWATILPMMAASIAATWEAGFEEHDGTMTVNRSNNIACFGGAAHDNQECYLLRKLMTGLGVYYVEHQARI